MHAETASAEIDWFGTLRGRVGVAKGPFLLFATGGLAYGQINVNGQVELFASLDDGDTHSFNSAALTRIDTTELGWTAGAGFEYAFNPNIIFGVSYQFVDFGEVAEESLQQFRKVGSDSFFSSADIDGSVDASFHSVQARLIFKFGDYAPLEPLK